MVAAALPVRGNDTVRIEQPRLPGLDGIRGVAVLAVLGYHLDLQWAGGGFLGVEIFFTLSGFLITYLLMAELRRRGRIGVAAFVRARARRLLPGLVACVLGTVVGYRLLLPTEAPSLRGDALASLLYAQNWHLVLAGIPYGAEFSRPPPLLHLWSLAVEVQLYLCWVLLLIGVVGRVRRSVGVGLTLVLAAASALVMAWRYSPDGGTLVYYATDARASGFLLGAALALIWDPETWSGALPRTVRRALDVAGVLALATLLVELATASEFSDTRYQWGGFLRVGLLVVVLIAAATQVDGVSRRALSSRLLVGAGKRSYGIYLYHWPVFALVRGAPGQGWLLDALALTVTFGVTEISYRWLETPIRRGGLGQVAWRLRLGRWALVCLSLWAAVTAVALVVASTLAPPTTSQSSPSTLVAAPGDQVPTPAPTMAPTTAAPTTAAPTAAAPMLVVGDSITLGSSEALHAALGPAVTVAAAVGRQFSAAPAIVADWARTHDGPVVVNLGANGTVEPRDLDALLAAAGRRRVVLVGVSVPRRWRSGNNDLLRATAAGHAPDVVLVDWAALVASHPGCLGPDRVHPGPQGRALLADAIASAVRS